MEIKREEDRKNEVERYILKLKEELDQLTGKLNQLLLNF